MKIICLGNEFIKEDSLAKKVGSCLNNLGYKIFNVNDSFQLIEMLNELDDFIFIDIVKRLKDVCEIKIDDVKSEGLVTTHDFDCGFVLKLMKGTKNVRIIGVPECGNLSEVVENVRNLLDFWK